MAHHVMAQALWLGIERYGSSVMAPGVTVLLKFVLFVICQQCQQQLQHQYNCLRYCPQNMLITVLLLCPVQPGIKTVYYVITLSDCKFTVTPGAITLEP
jgi:hypothetical protein